MAKPRPVRLALLLLLATALLSTPALPGLADDQSMTPAEPKTVIIESVDEAPRFGQRLVKDALKELPEGHKLQATVHEFFDTGHGKSSNQLEPYISSLVPVNAKGKKNGEQAFYEPRQGAPSQTITWKNGVKHGPERFYHGWSVSTEIPWKDGEVHGVRKQFNSEGDVTSETTYENGQIVGTAKSYDHEGRLIREVPYKDGEMHGKRIDYWPQTGEPRRIVPYVKGQSHGEVIEYHLNGKVKRRVMVKNGQLHGKEDLFNDDGEQIEQRYWLDGIMVSEQEYQGATSAQGGGEA